jgi:hypothetical protein
VLGREEIKLNHKDNADTTRGKVFHRRRRHVGANGDDAERRIFISAAAREARFAQSLAEAFVAGVVRFVPFWISVLHDEHDRVVETVRDERGRHHSSVDFVRHHVVSAVFVRGFGDVRGGESPGRVATGHGRFE